MKNILELLISGKSLSRIQAEQAMARLTDEAVTPEQVGALLIALRVKEETAEEITGFIDALSKRAHPLNIEVGELIDVCGTGGDNAGTFNVSTAVALILASLGVQVAKHGNRGVSSKSGSADVLDALRLESDFKAEQVLHSLKTFHVSFLFAPAFHPVLAKLAPIRKNLGVYTLFNALGPLLNPAPLTHQMVGVYHPKLLYKVGTALKEKGIKEAFVVHGSDGLDEFTLTGETSVIHLKDGHLDEFKIAPEDFGLDRAPLDAVRGGTPQENAQILVNIFKGEKSPKRDLVVMNAAAALILLGRETDYKLAVKRAEEALDSRKTFTLLKEIQKARNTK